MVFGDVYLTWNHAGVYLATIAMDYYDPALLAFGDTFPLGEAFHLDWGIDAGAGPQRFALSYGATESHICKTAPPHTRAHLCRLTNGTCEPVPGAVALLSGHGDPPHRRRGRPTVACLGSGGTTRSWPAPHGPRGHVLSPRPLDVLERPACLTVGLQETAAWHTDTTSADVEGAFGPSVSYGSILADA